MTSTSSPCNAVIVPFYDLLTMIFQDGMMILWLRDSNINRLEKLSNKRKEVKKMARVHDMKTLKQLVASKGWDSMITYNMGASGEYVKEIICNGKVVLKNCQQYNMGRKQDLWECLLGAMACNDTSKHDNDHASKYITSRNMYNGMSDDDYISMIQSQLLPSTTLLDDIKDIDLKFHIEHKQEVEYIESLINDFSIDLKYYNELINNWNSDTDGHKANSLEVAIINDRVITINDLDKIKGVVKRMKEMARV